MGSVKIREIMKRWAKFVRPSGAVFSIENLGSLRLWRLGRFLVSWFRLRFLHFLAFVGDP
jgi:hypothetical protein